jgi:putative transposase
MFKDNHWAENMHSQSAQFIIGEVINAYKSWFALRKNGNIDAKSPGFRRENNLSPVTFLQGAPNLFSKNGT